MEDLIEVTLIAPAKVDGSRKPVGAKVHVTKEVRDQLADSGAAVKLADVEDELEVEITEFEMAVKEKAEELVVVAVEDLVEETRKAEARAKAATERADRLEAERAEVEMGRDIMAGRAEQAEAKVAELEDQIAALTAEQKPSPASVDADKKSAPTKAAEKETGRKPAAKGKAT